MRKPRGIAHFVGGLLLAGSVGGAQAAPCAADLLSNYLGAAACEAGAVTLSGFTIEPFPGATSDIDPTAVTLVPVSGGFDLVAATGLAAATGELLGLRLLLQVSAAALSGGSIALGSGAAATADGVVTGLLDAGAAGNAIAIVTEGLSFPMESFSATASFFDIFVELAIDGGTAGSASLGPALASLRFATAAVAVPAPAPWALLALGLLGLAASRRRAPTAA